MPVASFAIFRVSKMDISGWFPCHVTTTYLHFSPNSDVSGQRSLTLTHFLFFFLECLKNIVPTYPIFSNELLSRKLPNYFCQENTYSPYLRFFNLFQGSPLSRYDWLPPAVSEERRYPVLVQRFPSAVDAFGPLGSH